jgi:hypothetical protein
MFGTEYYQDNIKIRKKEYNSLMLDNPASIELHKKYKLFKNAGYVAGGAALGLEIIYLRLLLDGRNLNTTVNVGIGLIGMITVSGACNYASKFMQKQSILSYNESLDSTGLYLGPTQNGLGLVYSF